MKGQLQLGGGGLSKKGLCIDFASTKKPVPESIADGLLRDLFPLSAKAHQMETRTAEKYKVLHANTERFRNSPIISMQRMLNTDEANSRRIHECDL